MEHKRDTSNLSNIVRMINMPYNYHAGFYYSKMLTEIRDHKRIYGVKCSKCGKVYVPPRIVCRDCFIKMTEFVPVSDEGILTAFTVVTVPYTDSETGGAKKLPFTMAFVQLDGTDSGIMHCLDESDEERIKVGMRVKAIYGSKETGNYFHDIDHFTIVK